MHGTRLKGLHEGKSKGIEKFGWLYIEQTAWKLSELPYPFSASQRVLFSEYLDQPMMRSLKTPPASRLL